MLKNNKIEQINECNRRLDQIGISQNNRHVFSQNLQEIIGAINGNRTIDGIIIHDAIRQSNFRFYSEDEPILSLEISNAFADMAASLRVTSPKFAKSGRAKRIENADRFAEKMHEVISDIVSKNPVSSYKETVKILNDKDIPTYSKGKWRE